MLRPRSVPFFARSLFDVARAKVLGVEVASGEGVDQRWPAHLHINLVPEAPARSARIWHLSGRAGRGERYRLATFVTNAATSCAQPHPMVIPDPPCP